MERCLACEAAKPTARQLARLTFSGWQRKTWGYVGQDFGELSRVALLVVHPGKEPGVACPRPGGEPLYKMAALSVSSRRLPGTSRRAWST